MNYFIVYETKTEWGEVRQGQIKESFDSYKEAEDFVFLMESFETPSLKEEYFIVEGVVN